MAKKYLLGIDIGSSSIKAGLLDVATGKPVATAFSPATEMVILSSQPGFAEQDPGEWWYELVNAMGLLKKKADFNPGDVAAIGISYQMHGLVCVDRDMKPLRPSIIWCDSRAVKTGEKAFTSLGTGFCLKHYLNSPGNFTASKLSWVKQNEPDLFKRIYKVMLPGDYIALRMTGEANTTITGLSEGILWDYLSNDVANELLDHYGLQGSLLAERVPVFGNQGLLKQDAAEALGLQAGIQVSYRAGDQPNNAWSLNVLEPGEIAATAGTSGVVYGITDKPLYDPASRVNAFVHVNHSNEVPRYGILLCINGTGSLNSWMKHQVFEGLDYHDMNILAAKVPAGSEGLQFYPFGNGAERVLENLNPGAMLRGLDFNHHRREHLARAAQEGIVFALNYGMSVMREMGMNLTTIRAGYANMFLSDVFSSTFANISGCVVELYNTDGAIGAARGAGIGAGIFSDSRESFRGMEMVKKIEPDISISYRTREAYNNWKEHLSSITV